MKVCALVPVYMADNCRNINKENLQKLKNSEFKYVDEVVICDQCFEPDDYIEGFTYLGPFKQLPYKVSDARNILFNYFYNSDYDYAILLDARESLSKAGLNSFVTLMDAIHKDRLFCDFIQGTIGQIANTERVQDKIRVDYKDNVLVKRMNSAQPHLHHTIISNFKKKYDVELYLPVEKMGGATGNKGAVPEDIYFSRLCQTYFDIFIVGEMCVNTGKQSASTWAVDSKEESHKVNNHDYYDQANKIILENYNSNYVHKGHYKSFTIDRVDEYRDLLGEYKSRKQIKEVKDNKVILFD